MKLIAFDRVELLVHPFFAAENARAKGRASGLRNVTEKDILKDYEELGIVDNWKRKVDRISKNPSAIMIIVGPQATETSASQILHFEGRLGEKKLQKFTQEYRDFLKYAKAKLGRKLFYMSHTIGMRQSELANLMLARGRAPYKKLRVYAYGEYLGPPGIKQCVDQMADATKELMEGFQKKIWKEEKTNVSLTKVKEVRTKKGMQAMSVESHHAFPSLARAEITRRLRKKGKISPYFLKFRMNVVSDYNFKHIANSCNKAWAARKKK